MSRHGTRPRPTRCRRTPIVTVLSLLLFQAATVRSAGPLRGRSRPNVVVLFADNLGYGDVGAFGSASVPGRTPAIDSLARDGLKLTAWNSVSHLCSPSRASLMTGRYPVRSGVYPAVFYPDSVKGMDKDEVTIADYLKKEGYATSILGKWHLGHAPGYLPTERGFDEWLGIPYSPCEGSLDGHICGFDADGTQWLPLYNGTHIVQQPVDLADLASAYADAADDFVGRAAAAARPFFLYVPFSHAHQLCAPLRETCQWADPARRDGGGATFGDAVEEMDWIAGRVLSSLETHGVADDTLVIFTSDNGPWLAEQSCSGSRGGFEGRWLRENVDQACTACPLNYKHSPTPDRPRRCIYDARGMDALGNRIYVVDGVHCGEDVGLGSVWEANLRVPALVRWTGTIAPGTENSEAAVATFDVLPTLLALLGVDAPTGKHALDGTDVGHVLFGDGGTVAPTGNRTHADLSERPLFFWREGFPDGPLPQPYGRYDVCAVRLGRIKAWLYTKSAHLNADPMVRHDPPLLFDWMSDPAEAYPLDPGEHAKFMERIGDLVGEHIRSMREAVPLALDRDPSYIPCVDAETGCRTFPEQFSRNSPIATDSHTVTVQ